MKNRHAIAPIIILNVFSFGLVVITCLLLFTGCGTTLQQGGAYNPVSTNALVVASPSGGDMALYTADATWNLAFTASQTAFAWELNNRDALWKLNPGIKHTMDAIRPKFSDVWKRWAVARSAYLASPSPANLGSLQGILQEAQAVAAAASAAVTPTVH